MTHEDCGKFAAKHPAGTQIESRIRKLVKEKLNQGTMPCVQAHRIAAALSVTPQEIGTAIDLLEGRIVQCQLGFFGYSTKKKLVHVIERVKEPLLSLIENNADAGRLDCIELWRIADQAGVSRLEAANACETLKIKIIHCQLGAF